MEILSLWHSRKDRKMISIAFDTLLRILCRDKWTVARVFGKEISMIRKYGSSFSILADSHEYDLSMERVSPGVLKIVLLYAYSSLAPSYDALSALLGLSLWDMNRLQERGELSFLSGSKLVIETRGTFSDKSVTAYLYLGRNEAQISLLTLFNLIRSLNDWTTIKMDGRKLDIRNNGGKEYVFVSNDDLYSITAEVISDTKAAFYSRTAKNQNELAKFFGLTTLQRDHLFSDNWLAVCGGVLKMSRNGPLDIVFYEI